MTPTPAAALSAQRPPQPAGVLLRLAAMTYEAVLLFGVLFIVSYAVLGLTRWTYPLADAQRWILQAILFVTLGAYFVYCWSRSGQTLAMKSWHLRVVANDGARLTLRRAVLRYLLAWQLFAPGLLLVAALRPGVANALGLLAASVVAMLLLAYADPQRQLLHDRWLGTRVIRE